MNASASDRVRMARQMWCLALLQVVMFAVSGPYPLSAQPSFDGWRLGESGSREQSHEMWYASFPRSVAQGDTIWFRHVFRNLADTTTTLSVLPCGPRLIGTEESPIDIRPLNGPAECEPEERRLAPGDSIAAEEVFEVRSPPGDYRLRRVHVSRSLDGLPISGGSTFRIVDDSEPRPFVPRGQGPGAPRVIYYALGFQEDISPSMSRQDVGDAVGKAIRGLRGRYSTMLGTRTALRRMFPAPYLLLEPEDRPGSDLVELRLRLIWNDATDGDGLIEPRHYSCVQSTGGVLNPVTFGSAIATTVIELLERLESGACGT